MLRLNMDRLPAEWEIQSESGTGARMAFHANFACVFLDDAVSNGKAQAGAARLAFARRRLGGEERVVDPLNVLGSNP